MFSASYVFTTPLRPTPKISRPLETWSKVAASSAMRSGLASGSTCTLVPILILSVRAAIAVPRTSGRAARARLFYKRSAREPHHVEAVFLAGVDNVEPGGEAFGLAVARQHRKLVIDT